MLIEQRQEWFWAIAWAIVILIITGLPYLYGATVSTSTNRFGGFVIGVEDGYSYLAKMRQGAAGDWLFHLAYTPEPHPGAPFFLYYILLGKGAKLLGLGMPVALHLSRVLTIPFGLLSFYAFTAYFTPQRVIRQVAYLLFAFSAGLGWLWLWLGQSMALGEMPVDLWVPDASFFLSALTFPHLPLAQGLLLWVVVATLRYLESGHWRWWAVAAGTGVLVSLIHPYTLPVLSTVIGFYLLYQVSRQNWPLWRSVGRLVLVIGPALPYLIYALLIFETNFAFQAWREQSLTLSPHPIHYLLGFGLLIPLVGLGLWQASRIDLNHRAFLYIWVLIIPLLLYVPIPLQRRFLDGYQAPLALLGGVGLVWLITKLRLRRFRRLALAGLLIPLTLTNLFLLMGGVAVAHSRQWPVFHSASQQAAFDWLAELAPGEVVLAAYQTGNMLPAYAPVRVFVGHGPETVDSLAKQAALQRFFNGDDEAFRRQLLRENGISYLFYGPAERDLGNFSPDHLNYLREVYDNGPVQIYRFLGT